MKLAVLLLVSTMYHSWGYKFPIDTIIRIPFEGNLANEKFVSISQLDTHLVFFTSPPTLTCPGSATGDIKEIVKKPTSFHPNPNQNWHLWTEVRTCGAQPNSITAYNKYYEYELNFRGTKLYVNFVKFIGPSSFQSGTFPPLEFQVRIDTISSMTPSFLKQKKFFVNPNRIVQKRINILGRRIWKMAIFRKEIALEE